MLKSLRAEIQRTRDEILGSQLGAGPTMIVIDVVNASEEGPHEIVPAGYTCNIQGKRQYFPGSAEQAGAAVRALMSLEPKTPGKVRPVPVLMACLEAPVDPAGAELRPSST